MGFPRAQFGQPRHCGSGFPRTAWLLASAFLLALAAAGCSSEPSTFGQYFQGRTLHVSLVSLERIPELRYSTVDPNQVVRRWSLSPSGPGSELVLARLKVENHTAVSAIINIDRTSAELRDFANTSYRPVPVSETVWQDFRGQAEAQVRLDLGQCFDGARALIDPGTTVKWQSEAEAGQYVAFQDDSISVGPGRKDRTRARRFRISHIRPAGRLPLRLRRPEYHEWPAEIQVVSPSHEPDVAARSVLFLEGSFELLKGHGLDGYLVFEAPVGTEFRDMRWKAGDSITIRF